MFRKLLPICVLLALQGCNPKAAVKPPNPPPAKDWTVTATWQYDFTNYKVCSSTVTAGCISGFTWGYLQGATQIPLKTSPASVCAGTTQPESCSDTVNATLGIGAVNPYIVTNYVDNSGAAGATTASAGTTDNVAAGLATGFSWTRK